MISDFTYHAPRSVEEVSAILSECGPNVRLLAGGTDLIVQLNKGDLFLSDLIDLNFLADLGGILDLPGGGLRIGATVRLSELVNHPRIRTDYQALWDGAITVGSVQIRNRATLVGNICNASPAADTAPGLLVYGAIANIRGPSGVRSLPVEKIFSSPGHTTLTKGEWMTSIDLPPDKIHGACYLKLGRTRGVDLALVGVAFYVADDDVRVAYSSAAPTPLLARSVGDVFSCVGNNAEYDPLVGETIRLALKPIDDIRALSCLQIGNGESANLACMAIPNLRWENRIDEGASHAI